VDKKIQPVALALKQTRRSLPMALLRAREAVMENFRPMLAELDVTEQQWRVLRVVAEAERLDATEVAKRASILGPSLTRIIKFLEKRKLIRRKKDNEDKRRVILEIAPNGKDLMTQGTPRSLAAHNQLEQALGADKLAKLLDLLDEVSALQEKTKDV
jgi:homoprotocatechuate degradation regulator HpaR